MKPLLPLLLALAATLAAPAREISVLQFNIWQEGTKVGGGFEAIADEIARLQPDFVTLSEVRNYNSTRFCDRIIEALNRRGCRGYHSFYSYDSGLLSRHEITDSATVFPHRDDHGSIYRLNATVNGRDVAVYTGHLDYLNDTYYEVRGYDGSTWRRLDAPLTDVATILERNALSRREAAIDSFLLDADVQLRSGAAIIFGGDFNEPSGLDWTYATKDSADHHGVVIDWPCAARLAEAGFRDAYRTVHPDPVTHPGYTYPTFNDSIAPERITWTPASDERERIDYIFYHPAALEPADARIVGPRDLVVRARRHVNTSSDPIDQPAGTWPSDHKALLVRFRLR